VIAGLRCSVVAGKISPAHSTGYTVVKGFGGRACEISWPTYLLAIVLVAYFVFVRSRIGLIQFT
jgi:hypothetical protein